jgi:hypothetical protein
MLDLNRVPSKTEYCMVSDGIGQNPYTHCFSHKERNIAINCTSDTVVQWIRARLVWERTRVQSYYKLDFFSVNTFSWVYKNFLISKKIFFSSTCWIRTGVLLKLNSAW